MDKTPVQMNVSARKPIHVPSSPKRRSERLAKKSGHSAEHSSTEEGVEEVESVPEVIEESPQYSDSSSSGIYPDISKLLETENSNSTQTVRSSASPELRQRKKDPEEPVQNIGSQSDVQEQRGFFNYFVGICIVIIIVIYYIWLVPEEESTAEDTMPQHGMDFTRILNNFKININGLQSKFSAQTRDTWVTVFASVVSVIQEEPQQPAVIILLAEKEAECTTDHLAQEITIAVTEAFQDEKPQVIDGTAIAVSSPEDQKLRMEKELVARLNKAHAVYLKNVDKLHGQGAMILHAYFDNINAPYKQAVFVLSLIPDYQELHIGLESNTYGQVNLDEIAGRILCSVWKEHLPLDILSALLSRIVVSAVLVKAEK